MKRIAKFEKVSITQFKEGCDRPDAEEIYRNIKLPHRATAGSAGYDFYAPYDVKLEPGETAKIPTGIRVLIEQGWVLKLYPRSGKFRKKTIDRKDEIFCYIENKVKAKLK